jgi:hypothetical protein
MKHFALLAFLVCVTIACSAADRDSQIDDIREATFRYQFAKNASGQQATAKVYFLSFIVPGKLDGHDPSDDFMKRFAGHNPRVAKASQAKTSKDDVVRDSKTGEQGLIFSLNAIHWKSDTEVEVSGGYYEASESASSNTYYLVKKSGKWIVERDVMDWISLNTPNQPLERNAYVRHAGCVAAVAPAIGVAHL